VLAASVVILLLTRGSFGKVQYLFVAVGIGVSLAYFASALMSNRIGAKPSGHFDTERQRFGRLLVGSRGDRWYDHHAMGPGVHTVLLRRQAPGPEDLIGERLDVGLGALLTNLIAAFIVVACASALWSHNVQINTNDPSAVASIAQALAPLAGEGARISVCRRPSGGLVPGARRGPPHKRVRCL